MKINQGLFFVIFAILGISFCHYAEIDELNIIFFFLFGFSLNRFDRYWNIKKAEKNRQQRGAK